MYQVPTNNLPLSPLDDLPPPPPDIDGGYLGNNMYDVVPPPPPAMMNEGGAVVPETYEEKGELIVLRYEYGCVGLVPPGRNG